MSPPLSLLLVSDTGRMPPDITGPLEGQGTLGLHAAGDLDRLSPAGFTLAIVDITLAEDSPARGPFGRFARRGALPCLFVVSASRPESAYQARQLGADDVLVRPFTSADLLARIRRLAAKRGQAPAARATERVVAAPAALHPAPERAAPALPARAPAAVERAAVERAAGAGDPVRLQPKPAASRAEKAAAALRHAIAAGDTALASAFAAVGDGQPPRIAPFTDASHSFVAGLAEAASSAASLSIWLDTVRSHHSATFRHSLTVTANAVLFGLHLNLRKVDLERLAVAGLLHDIGKSVVPLEILDKPGRLDEAELALIRRHPQIGRDLLARSPDPIERELIDVVAHHHEYLDGSGYPDALTAERIPDLVRITTIADIFTALVEERSYKAGMEPARALAILQEMADGGKLDPVLVRSFAAMVDLGPPQATAAAVGL